MMNPILFDWNIMPSYEDLVEEHDRLERNLLNAVDESTAIAIYKRIQRVNDAIFELKFQ